ncbi:hypothetical protein PG993_006300 [Apiospora rasikravindrae]|uniref:Uncharacterized protein n=1 Tax=Apiospora rasikravindrae TaxID=990691 RepID=A0ABR1T5B6_9PEZI
MGLPGAVEKQKALMVPVCTNANRTLGNSSRTEGTVPLSLESLISEPRTPTVAAAAATGFTYS